MMMHMTIRSCNIYGVSDLLGVSPHEARNAMISIHGTTWSRDDCLWILADDLLRALGAPADWQTDRAYSINTAEAMLPRIVYNTAEVAERLGTTQLKVRGMIRSGEIPGGRMWLRYFVLRPVLDAMISPRR